MSANQKSSSKPVRLDPDLESPLQELSQRTGIPQVELIRRSIRYVLPKFESGEVNILDCGVPPHLSEAKEETA